MDDLDQKLQSIIYVICKHPPTSSQHQKALNSLLRTVLTSGRVYKDANDLYEDALSETMMMVSKQLCNKYDSSRGTFLAWFNTCLRNKYIDMLRSKRKEHIQSQNNGLDPLNLLAAGIDATLLVDTWDSFVQWIENDLDGVLSSCHIECNCNANCQLMAKYRIIEGKEWNEIAKILDLPYGTVSSHWSRKCQLLMEEWLEQNQRLF